MGACGSQIPHDVSDDDRDKEDSHGVTTPTAAPTARPEDVALDVDRSSSGGSTSSGDGADDSFRDLLASAANPREVVDGWEFTNSVLNTARQEVCSKYEMSEDGMHNVHSPGHVGDQEHSFQSMENMGLYQRNATAIHFVISNAIKIKLLPAHLRGRAVWELCRSLGYLSCDCTRACTGKFQTVLEDYSLMPTPPGSFHNMVRSSSAPQAKAALMTPSGDRRKSLSQADILQRRRQLVALSKKGTFTKMQTNQSFNIPSGGGRLPARIESQSDADDWDDEDVEAAGTGDDLAAIMEDFSPTSSTHSSPKKRRQSATTVRLAIPPGFLHHTANGVTAPTEEDDEDSDQFDEYFTFRCHAIVGEAKGPPFYMEDRHICLNPEPFAVYKMGVNAAELQKGMGDPKLNPYETLFGVIDGHGGELVAESLFVDFPRLLTAHPDYQSDIDNAINETCAKIDLRYVENTVTSSRDPSGAVATFMLIRDRQLICANVGDCRAVLSRSGLAVQLTQDHSLDNPTELNRVKKAGVPIKKNRIFGDLAVTRSFGDARHKPKTCSLFKADDDSSVDSALDDAIISVPEITKTIIREADEFVIMASDGLWDVFDSQTAVEYVRSIFNERRSSALTITKDDVAYACKKLIKEAQKRGTRDNTTVCIVCLWCRLAPPANDSTDEDEDEFLDDEEASQLSEEEISDMDDVTLDV